MKRITCVLSWTLTLTLVFCPTISFALVRESKTNLLSSKKPVLDLRIKRPTAKSHAQGPTQLLGQTTTVLPGGDLLLIGGEGPTGPEKTSWIRDGQTGQMTPLATGLLQARAYHSATMLPNGNVLILGGIGANGQIESRAEVFESEFRSFKPLKASPPSRRAHHTATLLTDGRVLIAGGISARRRALAKAELWNARTEMTTTLPAELSIARYRHKATLLSDGSVSFERGEDSFGNKVRTVEIFDPQSNTFSVSGTSPEDDSRAAYPVASLPENGAANVPVDTNVALRFSRQLRADSVNSETVSLTGLEGVVDAKLVPAENGRLVFITPRKPLLAGVTYTVSLSGSVDDANQTTQTATLTFTTKAEQEPVNQAGDDEDWIPDASNFHGQWKSKHKDSPWRSLPPLQAAPGVTALAGQALTLNGKPLVNVTLKSGDKTALTDQTGRFLLSSISAGHHVLNIDGRTASRHNKEYGIFRVGVDIKEGKTNVLDYTVWMSKLDSANAMVISSPTRGAMSLTNPRIPGLELRLPAGTVIRDLDGESVMRVSITPIPTNRPPFPLPPGIDVPVYFTIQPGGSQIIPPRAQLIYPNFIGSRPGTRIDFWNYDPTERGWYVYGQGTVTPDGRQIIPDPGVVLYEFSGAMVGSPSLAPDLGPLDGAKDGDPVDLGTGLFVLDKTDLTLPGTIPIKLTRTYRPNDTVSRPFGIGATHPYEIFLVGSTFPYTYVDLIMPDGGRVHYDRISPGTIWLDAVYEATSTPTIFYKSKITWNGDGWDLKLKDGTLYVFPEAFSPPRPSQCALMRVQDRFGNILNLTRDANSNLTKITTPNNRWIQFSYDTSYRITQASDNIGRLVTYTYDTSGRLWKVTDPKNGVTEYTYDSSHRMLTVKDARGIVYLTNEYDTNGRVSKQTLADDTPANPTDNPTYQFAYTTDSGGRIIQTDVTDPRGNIRRVTFNSAGYRLTDTSAVGRPEQQGVSLERQAGTNFVQAIIDPLGRRSEYGFDSMGNVNSVTEFAGTTAATTTTFVYEPTFNEVTSVTDPLNRTTSYSYDSKGSLTKITDPLNHETTFSYNAVGQVISASDPLQHTMQFVYDSGDLVQVRDPLNRTLSLFLDSAGRLRRVTDAIGNATRYDYDALNQITKVTEQLGGATEFAYDPNGNLLSVKDALNQITSFTYDSMDRVLTRTDPLQGGTSVETYEYDLAGNPTKFTDRRSKVTTFIYDGLDRPVFVGYGTSAGPTYESTLDYTYDVYDRVTQVIDSVSGTIAISFDDLARTASETTPQGTIGYSYDIVGRLIAKTVSGQSAISYSYDNADRLLTISQGSASVNSTYDEANRRTALTLPNGIVAEYAYDAASQLTGITYKNGATVIGDLTYQYDQSGRRTKVGGSYARTGLPQALSGATYNAANRLTQRGAASLTYDANGNLTNDGVTTYTWDARNQLAAISGSVTASFQYDAFGRRVQKTVNGVVTDYLYDGDNVVQEKMGGTPSANLLTGGIDEVFSRADTSATQSLLKDGLGSTVALLDSAGLPQTEYTYEPFGNTGTSGAASANASQYTGRENDGTGLYYYRARYYSPTLQRFISEDPIGFNGGDPNLYAYVRGNPINRRDPFGLNDVPATSDGPNYPTNRPPPPPSNYVNVQVSGGWVIGGFGGVIIGESGFYPYVGGGMVFGTLGVSITKPVYPWDSPDPARGWNTEQGGCFIGCGTFGGAAEGSGGKPTIEGGFGYPTKGYHGGVYYVFGPFFGSTSGRKGEEP